MRRLLLPALLALVSLLAVPASADRPAGPQAGMQSGTFDTATGPALKYLLYVPAAVADRPHKKVPLFVYLHGCNQNAADAAVGSRLAQLAEEKGILVLVPEQTRPVGSSYPVSDGNGSGCWNWFLPDHQTRDKGEPATLAGLTRDVMDRFAVDSGRVWLAGVSAGADMATILAATSPDLYRAVAPIAGCAYLTCSDVSGTAAHRAMGDHAQVVPTLVVQGSADMVNNAAMGGTAVSQWLGTNDLADDGELNGSVPRTPTSTTDHPAVQGTPPGDPCVGNSRLPCAGGVLGLQSYPYTVLEYGPTVTALVIHGANHAYTGGDPRGTFVDPVGPDLGHAMYDFFAAHTRR
ncbi:MAG: hypothetical protein JWN77_1054 [Frankiales bacterium]|nr:hypothetical protein [Frankiales bacterium]